MSDTTKPTYSPSPWHLEFIEYHSGDSTIVDANYEDVADNIHGETVDQMRANGYLIAAAPDQNTALKRVATALVASSHSEKYVSEDDWNPDTHVEIVLTIADARAVYAAIAKAEGKVSDAS